MGLFSKFIAKIKGTNDFSPADWADLEQELLSSDIGPKLTTEFLEAAKKVKGENAEAKAAFSTVVSQFADSNKRGDSLVKLGMIAEKDNDIPGAKALYQKVLKDYKNLFLQ